jgi:glycosyltransferase involved in cell wall biosynthesis
MAGIQGGIDPVWHYLEEGWRQGLEPNQHFGGSFLRPFYEAAGLSGPPAAIWLELSAAGSPLPVNQAEAVAAAQFFRAASGFDADFYRSRLPPGMDPALHYAVVGERMGWRPAPHIDPVYYVDRYPDIAAGELSPFVHFEKNGRQEGRRSSSVVDRLHFAPLPRGEEPVVLVVSHEASRTGAPVLGWNLARLLARKARIVSLLMRGGELEDDFAEVSSVSVGPLTWEDWNPADMSRLAEWIVREYRPHYAVANSIETHAIVPPLAALGVPSVALVHEFAAYTRPLPRMRDIYDWASHVVFPARIVADSSFKTFSGLQARPGIHIIAQGRNDPPRGEGQCGDPSTDLLARLRATGEEEVFLVVGAGSVHYRKGVDLFISVAATARRLNPDLKFRFVWIGHGYNPELDVGYSTYLAEQIAHSDLGDSFIMLDAVEDLEPVYATADALLMCSRLDPQPNVGIDAICRGIPTLCFEGASGTAEILGADPATRQLVVPHLDTHAMAALLCKLAEDRMGTSALRQHVTRVGQKAYDIDAYIDRVDELGRDAAAALHQEDLATLLEAGIVDPDLALPPGARLIGACSAERQVLQQWSIMGLSPKPTVNPQFRRPCAGFNPQTYAHAHPVECRKGGVHPLAHWLRAGQPAGPWSRPVYTPADLSSLPTPENPPHIALHAHFHYETLAADFIGRLDRNGMSCDLFLSTNTQEKAEHLRKAFREHSGSVEIEVVPNRGRDIGPFVTGFGTRMIEGGYDLVGHVHGKRSLGVDVALGEAWRHFLWENLIGGEYPMLDLAARIFAANSSVGLLMPEDPHLVGWDENRAVAEGLAWRMGLADPLDDFFDFPLGTMFWARPAALLPLLGLGLDWNDYPSEPLPNDGTILHALERLMPFVVRHAGFDIAGVRVPGTTW